MFCYSTKNKYHRIQLKEAILQGIAPDGSLYMPENIPVLSKDFLETLPQRTFEEIAQNVIIPYFGDHIPSAVITEIIREVFNFPVPVVQFSDNLFVCELYHGPTFAFKDFGARFLSRVLSYYQKDQDQEILILVATSGDTGGAVAAGFHGVKGIKVGILYPSGGVSPLQEKQLTTWGDNVFAYEVQGSFDDCQRLVKTALTDTQLRQKFKFSSANSINLARLIPQSLYYFEAYKQMGPGEHNVMIVPSGNLGNLFAGILAKAMGLKVKYFIAACNANATFTNYLNTGVYIPGPTVKTLSNAMDVGNPSNFERIDTFYGSTWNNRLRADIKSYSISDESTLAAMLRFRADYDYLLDPHGAVGYAAYLKEQPTDNQYCILETAHPAKFDYIYERYIQLPLDIPPDLAKFLTKEKKSMVITSAFAELKEALLSL